MTYDMQTAAWAFLDRWGVTAEELVRHAPPLREGECFALMGSIVEGVANEESDIDLLYLGDGDLADKVVITFENAYRLGVSHDQAGREINVEQLTTRDLQSLAASVERSLQAVHAPKRAVGVSMEKDVNRLRMIHRVGNCIPLVNAPALAAWQARLRTSELHVFLCLCHVESVMNQQEDIVGELAAGEVDSALWMVRTRYLPTLLAAMLTSVGETNQQTKWHHKLLMRHRDVIGGEDLDRIFAFMDAPASAQKRDLADQLIGMTEPALRRIHERQRAVRRAALAFSHMARYNDLRNPNRWTRPVPAGAN